MLRALAALLVVLTHAQHEAAEIWADKGFSFDEKTIPGDAGVDIFFVLSGFIMVYVARDQFGVRGAPLGFMLRRIARVAPLYWICTTLMIAVVGLEQGLVTHHGLDVWHVVKSYLFIPHQREGDHLVRPVFALGWTLTFEMMFYAVFALGLFLTRRSGLIAVMATIAGAVALGLVFRPEATVLAYFSHPIILEFAVGVAIGWLYVTGRVLSPAAILPGLVAGLVLLGLAPHLSYDMDPLRVVYFGLPATIMVGACLLGATAETDRMVPAIASRLGDSSYSLYLSHPFALGLFRQAFVHLHLDSVIGPWGFVAAASVFCLVVGHLTFVVVEKPIMRRTRKVLGDTVHRVPLPPRDRNDIGGPQPLPAAGA